MKRRWLPIVTAILLCWVFSAFGSATAESGGGTAPLDADSRGEMQRFQYKVLGDGGAVVTGFAGKSAEVEIPAVLDGHPVTGIGQEAFLNHREFITVTVPEGVTVIERNAFRNCTGLTHIILPDSITAIQNSAFDSCAGLTSLTLPDSLVSIGPYAFHNCSGLTRITIPSQVRAIESWAFLGCARLTSAEIQGSGASIGYSAFKNCSSLKAVTIHEGVEVIGKSAFEGCDSLASVTVPSSVRKIESNAFGSSPELTLSVPSDSYALKWCQTTKKVYKIISDNKTLSSDCIPWFSVSVEEAKEILSLIVENAPRWTESTAPQTLNDFPLMPTVDLTAEPPIELITTEDHYIVRNLSDLPFGYAFINSEEPDYEAESEYYDEAAKQFLFPKEVEALDSYGLYALYSFAEKDYDNTRSYGQFYPESANYRIIRKIDESYSLSLIVISCDLYGKNTVITWSCVPNNRSIQIYIHMDKERIRLDYNIDTLELCEFSHRQTAHLQPPAHPPAFQGMEAGFFFSAISRPRPGFFDFMKYFFQKY